MELILFYGDYTLYSSSSCLAFGTEIFCNCDMLINKLYLGDYTYGDQT
jgi:hypothetical protein